MTMGIISLVCAPLFVCCGVLAVVPSVVGFSLGVTAWVLGRKDLEKMKTQLMDPRGRGTTHAGKVCGIVGTCLNSVGMLVALGIAAFYSYMMFNVRRPPPAPPPPPPPTQKVWREEGWPLRLADYLATNLY
jgi:hypothetical protein